MPDICCAPASNFTGKIAAIDIFDQFLGELSSAKRKNLRKERASVREAGVTFDWLTGSDITEAHWDQFFDFYMDTGGRKWGTPYLTREFFSRLGPGPGATRSCW